MRCPIVPVTVQCPRNPAFSCERFDFSTQHGNPTTRLSSRLDVCDEKIFGKAARALTLSHACLKEGEVIPIADAGLIIAGNMIS